MGPQVTQLEAGESRYPPWMSPSLEYAEEASEDPEYDAQGQEQKVDEQADEEAEAHYRDPYQAKEGHCRQQHPQEYQHSTHLISLAINRLLNILLPDQAWNPGERAQDEEANFYPMGVGYLYVCKRDDIYINSSVCYKILSHIYNMSEIYLSWFTFIYNCMNRCKLVGLELSRDINRNKPREYYRGIVSRNAAERWGLARAPISPTSATLHRRSDRRGFRVKEVERT
jgi:hypothetical protein